jgi:hypothetical protein
MNARNETDGVRRGTGRSREEWFGALDAWGAVGRPYREIADWLTSEHRLSSWWAQKLIVEYEQARGVRDPGVRRDGTFEVGASKTIAASSDRVTSAFGDPDERTRWLPDAIAADTGEPGQPLRFGWTDGASRVIVTIGPTTSGKTLVGVQHQRLPDAKVAGELRTYWRDRLVALKALLEG